MTKTLRDLLREAHALRADLQDAGLFTAAGFVTPVIDAIRVRETYDHEGGTDDDNE